MVPFLGSWELTDPVQHQPPGHFPTSTPTQRIILLILWYGYIPSSHWSLHSHTRLRRLFGNPAAKCVLGFFLFLARLKDVICMPAISFFFCSRHKLSDGSSDRTSVSPPPFWLLHFAGDAGVGMLPTPAGMMWGRDGRPEAAACFTLHGVGTKKARAVTSPWCKVREE